jgi:hypothetical protein
MGSAKPYHQALWRADRPQAGSQGGEPTGPRAMCDQPGVASGSLLIAATTRPMLAVTWPGVAPGGLHQLTWTYPSASAMISISLRQGGLRVAVTSIVPPVS